MSVIHKTTNVIPNYRPTVNGRRIKYTLSVNDEVDRDHDIVGGPWLLGDYRRNPVILAFHDYRSIPIGRTTQIAQVGSELVAEAEFAEHPAAEQIFQAVKSGQMPGASVGFQAVDDPKPNKHGGLTYGTVRLLEWSVTPVPSLASAFAKSLTAKSLSSGSAQPDKTLMERAATLAASLVVAAEEGERSLKQFLRELPEHELKIVEAMIKAGELDGVCPNPGGASDADTKRVVEMATIVEGFRENRDWRGLEKFLKDLGAIDERLFIAITGAIGEVYPEKAAYSLLDGMTDEEIEAAVKQASEQFARQYLGKLPVDF
jgi:HK97 family phage prohead protease